MEVIVKKNYEEMSKAAATLFAAEIMENPKTILGMATGSTPVGLYKELVKMYEAGDLDFSQVTTFNLDEYVYPHKRIRHRRSHCPRRAGGIYGGRVSCKNGQ